MVIGEPVEKTLGYTSLVALRTAATSGVAFKYMVRENAETCGLLGSGGQAANQLLALLCARPGIKRVKLYSRSAANRKAFAGKYGQQFGVEIVPTDRPEDVIEGVDVVVCATKPHDELFDGNLLEPGQHCPGTLGGHNPLQTGRATWR